MNSRLRRALSAVVLLGCAGAAALLRPQGARGERHVDAATTACDVRRIECQERLFALVSKLSGVAAARPPQVRLVSTGEFSRATVDSERARPLFSPRIRAALVSLRLLDSRPATRHADYGGGEHGIYRAGSDDILLSAPPGSHATPATNAILAHEFVHAVQARRGLFETQSARSFDEQLAWRARLEGEAVVVSYRVKATLEGLDPGRIDWTTLFEHWSAAPLERVGRAAAPLAVAIGTFPYARGALWYSAGETTSVAWPTAFGALLEPPGSRGTPVATPDCEGEAETLGALSLLAFLLPSTKPAAAYSAARAVAGDRLCVGSGGDFSWHIVLANAEGSDRATNENAGQTALLVAARTERAGLKSQVELGTDSARVRIFSSSSRPAVEAPSLP